MTRRRPGSAMTAALVSMVVLAAVLVAQQKPATQKTPPTSPATSPDALLGQALHEEEVEGRLQNAIALYQKVLKAPGVTRAQAGRAQFRIGACYERLGLGEARKAYEAVVANYADQVNLAAEAKARLAALAEPAGRGTDSGVRRIWATTGGASWYQVSPDGRSVVGIDDDTGDLVIRSLATSQTRRLTAIPKDRPWEANAGLPIWSRDGRQIAYRWSSRGAPAELRIADVADGTSRTVPMDARYRLSTLEDWSPDGRRVLARVEEGLAENRRLHLAWVTTTGGTVQLLAGALDQRPGSALLAPDGAWVVCRTKDDDTGFSIVAAGGGPPRALIPAGTSDSLVGWSADGAHMLFISREGALNDLMAVRVVDGQVVDQPFLIRTLQAFSPLGVSQAGALLFRSTQGPRTNLYRARFDAASGRVSPPSSVDVSTGHLNGSVSWSPDGRRLAYVSWPDGRPARTLSIWSAENARTRSFSLPFNAQRWSWLPTTWSADGRWVYVTEVDDAGRQGLHRVDTGSGTVETVLPPASGMFPAGETSKNPATSLGGWSPDARVVYKVEWTRSRQPAQLSISAILEHRLADHAERELFKSGGPNSKVSGLGVSADGSQLGFLVIDHAAHRLRVMVMPAAGGPAKTVTELPTTVEGVIRWMHDGRSVVLALRGDSPQGRLLCNVATGVVTTLTPPSKLVEDIAVSPDGREIAYVGGHEGKDEGVWMLENFLPLKQGKTPPQK